jgi:decaprenyl-phosphate phosphoribosyltransferase
MKHFKDLKVDFKNSTVILDVDGTITFDAQSDASDCVDKIEEIKKNGNKIYLCSNGRNKGRLVEMSKKLRIDYIKTDHKKPSKKVIKDYDFKDSKLIVIGDKTLTDGHFAKKIKADFIKVKRLNSKKDRTKIKIINFIDDVASFIFINLRILRPNHWIKNLLVFAPIFFAKEFLDVGNLWKGVMLFIVFSALASAIYVFNDLRDKEADKLHPKKKKRPLASGEMSNANASVLIVLLIGLAALLGWNFPTTTLMILSGYVVLNVFYSILLKHVPIIDIFSVAAMYVIRIYAGGSFFDVHLSAWIILCTFFLALFLVIAKRKSEFNAVKSSTKTRKVMSLYNNAFLDHMLTISTTFCLISYSLYLVSFDDNSILYAFFFVLFGVMRYLYLVYRYNLGESPESIVVKDPWMIVSIIGWVAYNFYFLY